MKTTERRRRSHRRDMGAIRLLLGTLHYMGLYMQLSVSARQAAHGGELENHISGNGKCENHVQVPLERGWWGGGHLRGGLWREHGIGDAICSHAEEEAHKESRLRG